MALNGITAIQCWSMDREIEKTVQSTRCLICRFPRIKRFNYLCERRECMDLGSDRVRSSQLSLSISRRL